MEKASSCCLSMQLSYRMDAKISISDSRRRHRKNGRAEDQDSLRMERDRDT